MHQMYSISQTAKEYQARKKLAILLKTRSAYGQNTLKVKTGVVYVKPKEGEHQLKQSEHHYHDAPDH